LGSTWWGKITRGEGVNLIDRALGLGITFFDTGDVYGSGANEEIVGKALAGIPRDRVQISTKFGYVIAGGRQEHSQGERPQDWSPAHARSALEASLSRLGTDYVDLYQLHNARMDAIERGDLFEELERLRDEGKLRHYGVALGPAIGWREEGLRAIAERSITSVQTVYNVLEQDPGRDFLEAAAERGIGVMARVPTSSGLLEDKYTLETTFPSHDHRSHRPREWLVEGLQKVEQLRFLRSEHGITMARAPARYDDVLQLRARITRLGDSSLTTEIDVVREGEVLVEGRLRHVFVDAETWRKTKMPDWIAEGLRRFAGPDAGKN